jgi:hypothetical protein
VNGVVLYIDDSPDNILVVQRLFKRKCPDVQLRTAMTGRDGITGPRGAESAAARVCRLSSRCLKLPMAPCLW